MIFQQTDNSLQYLPAPTSTEKVIVMKEGRVRYFNVIPVDVHYK